MNRIGNLLFKMTCIMVLVAALGTNAGSVQAAESELNGGTQREDAVPFPFGVDRRFLSDVDPKDGVAAVNVWANALPIMGERNFEVLLLSSEVEIVQAFKSGQIVAANSSSLTYLKTKQQVDVESLFCEVIGGKKKRRYFLLVRKDAAISGLEQLRGRTLSVKKGDEISPLFVNTRLMEQGLPRADMFFSEIQEKRKYSQVINGVFFRQSDACLVPDYFLSVMNELNPQIGQQLKTLAASEELVDRLTFVRSDMDERLKKRIIHDALTLQDYAKGRQILLLFKTDRLELVNESEIEPLRKMLETYERLSRRSHGDP